MEGEDAPDLIPYVHFACTTKVCHAPHGLTQLEDLGEWRQGFFFSI